MTGFDWFLAVLFFIGIVLEMKRGFGHALFDCLALYSALLIASAIGPSVGHSIPGVGTTPNGYADCQIAVFLCCVITLLVVAHFSANAAPINLGMFDIMGGMVAGAVCVTILCHGLVTALSLGDSEQIAALSGNLSQQMLNFSSFHSFMDSINTAMSSQTSSS